MTSARVIMTGDVECASVNEKQVTIGADDSVDEPLKRMSEHGVSRLPVSDVHQPVGVLTQADVAKNLPEESVGDLVGAISSAPSIR